MARWWTKTALTLMCLGFATAAPAQYLMPTSAPTPAPEPLPYAPAQGSPAPGPGPMAPPTAPMPGAQQDSPLSLPGDITNGFYDPRRGEPSFAELPGCYINFGPIALTRARPQHRDVAYFDPTSNENARTIPPGATPILDFHKLRPSMTLGMTATVGYHWEDEALELTGFFIPDSVTRVQRNIPGQLDVPFVNAPIGFLPFNNPFTHADIVRLRLQSSLSSAELNGRYFSDWFPTWEWIVGVRYLDFRERVNIFTGDDLLQPVPLNPLQVATYTTVAHNHIIGGQFGFECSKMCCDFLGFGMQNKNLFGANFIDREAKLIRGDGATIVGNNSGNGNTVFASALDFLFFMDFYFMERGRLRAGYNYLEIIGVARSTNQVNFDLSGQQPQNSSWSSILYQGPVIELQFLF